MKDSQVLQQARGRIVDPKRWSGRGWGEGGQECMLAPEAVANSIQWTVGIVPSVESAKQALKRAKKAEREAKEVAKRNKRAKARAKKARRAALKTFHEIAATKGKYNEPHRLEAARQLKEWGTKGDRT